MQTIVHWIIIFLITLCSFGCSTTGHTFVYYKVRVKSGDTLASLAQRFDADWEQIAFDNDIKDARKLSIGTFLVVRPGPAFLKHENIGDMPAGTKLTEFKSRPSGIASGHLLWPTDGSLSSRFGWRNGRPHQGIDIRANRGTPIYAVDAGRVSFVGWKRGYGRTVVVTHDNTGYTTLYAHCQNYYVRSGDRVRTGDRLASVGKTGNATGYHLHFELRHPDRGAVNPLPWLRRSQVQVASSITSKSSSQR